MARVTACDRCGKIVEGDVKKELIVESSESDVDGCKVVATLPEEFDFCQACANKQFAVACMEAWNSVKKTRKLKPKLAVAA